MASDAGTFFTVEKKTTLGATYYLHIEFDSTKGLEDWVEWLEKDCDLFAIDPDDLPFTNDPNSDAPAPVKATSPARQRGQVPTRGAPSHPKSGVSCGFCGGPTWDNRKDKTNPKAPDFRCKDRESCGGAAWIKEDGELNWKQ